MNEAKPRAVYVDPMAIAAAQAKLRAHEAAYAARPHCTVTGSSLAGALKSLAAIFEHRDSGDLVVVAFDGRSLSFDCNGLKTDVAARGTAWPTRYELKMSVIADALPIRLKLPEVEVGIWKSTLEIDRARLQGVKKFK